MTRKEKLISMNGALLIQVADSLGVKVSCNRTRNQLKEAKMKVVERILEAEGVIEAEKQVEPEETIEELVGQDSLEDQKEFEKQVKKAEPKKRESGGKQIEFDGRSMNLNEWAKELGMTRQTLYARLYIQNWTVEKAFTTPGRKAK